MTPWRRLLALLLPAALLLAAGSTPAADVATPEDPLAVMRPLPLTAAEKALIAQHPVLRLGVESSWAPIEFFDETGHYSGVISSYMHALEKKLGVRFELVHKATFSEVLEAFGRGEIDVISALGKTEARETSMVFSTPFLSSTDGIIVRSDEPYVERLRDFPAGKRLAAVQGYGSSERAAASHPQLKVVSVRTTEEALIAVSTGRADIAVASLAAAYWMSQNQGLANLRVAANFDEYEQSMSMAFQPALASLVPLFNTALESIPPGQREALRARWTNVEIDRGISRRTVVLWTGLAFLVLLLMVGWVVTLLSQQRRREALRQRAEDSEAQFRAMIEIMPAVFWTLRLDAGRAPRFTFFAGRQPSLAKLRADAQGGSFEQGTQSLSAEDRARFQLLLDQHGRTLTPLHFEHRIMGTQDAWAYVMAIPRREREGLVWHGTTIDVSDRKRLEAALEQSRNQLAELAAGVPGALWQFRRETDGTQRYSYMSDGIVAITGRSASETNQLMQDKSFVSVHPDDLHILQALMQRLSSKGGIDEARYRLQTIDGGWKWVQVATRAMPVGPDGALVWNGITMDATRIQETEEALRVERERLQDLTDNFSGALWRLRRTAGGELRFDFVSEGVLSVTGRTATEIMRSGGSPLDRVSEEDRPKLQAALAESAATGRPFELEFWVRAKNESPVRLFCRGGVRFEAGEPLWTGVMFNVSDRYQLERTLADARARIDDIAANFPGAIFQMRRDVDGALRYTYVSQGITALTGRPPRTEVGREEFDIGNNHIHADDFVRVRQQIAGLTEAAGGSTQFDYRLINAGGEARWVHCALTMRREPDGSLIYNGLLLDAEPSKRLEAELRAAQAEAEAASRAKTRFLANMSHEIRTPMNAVIGLAHIAMTSTDVTPPQAERIGKIHRSGKALLKLLNDILEYARLDAGKFTPVPIPFDLHDIKGDLRLFCTPAAETKGLSFVIDCPGDTHLHWLGDATRIQQVLLNLITNAIKFTDAGQVTLVVRETSEPCGLLFEVHDSGIGMSDEQMSRVFKAFEQASGDTERRYGGTGLGLSISRELVLALGGSIDAESRIGAGTVFRVRLPLARAALPLTATLTGGDADLDQRLSRLAAHIAQRQTAPVRDSLAALRILMIAKGRAGDLQTVERLLASFDYEAAEVELATLRARWREKAR